MLYNMKYYDYHNNQQQHNMLISYGPHALHRDRFITMQSKEDPLSYRGQRRQSFYIISSKTKKAVPYKNNLFV